MTQDAASTRAVPIERIVSVAPFIVERRIAFRDCDPAGIVYTPRFLDPISTSAGELFLAELIGLFGDRDAQISEYDFPAKAVSMVFHRPVHHGDHIMLHVSCTRIGNTTFDVSVAGRSDSGESLFDCITTLICIDRVAFAAKPLPTYLLQKLHPYLNDES